MTEQEAGRPVTFTAAQRLNPFALARTWAEQPWPPALAPQVAEAAGVPVRTATDDLEELAAMAALRSQLDAWLPLQVHRALRAGADVTQTAAAAGLPRSQLAELWQGWSGRQLALQGDLRRSDPTYPDRSAEHDQVAAVLNAARGQDASAEVTRTAQTQAGHGDQDHDQEGDSDVW